MQFGILSDSNRIYVKPLLTLSYLYVTHQTRCLPFARVKGIKKGSVEYFVELTIFHYF